MKINKIFILLIVIISNYCIGSDLTESKKSWYELSRIDELNKQLFIAIRNNKVNDAKKVIEAGANVNAINVLGNSALHSALINQCNDIVELLLAKKASVDIRNQDRATPIAYVLNNKDSIKLTKLLIEHGADVNNKNYLGENILFGIYSSLHDTRYELAKFLLEETNIDVNAKNIHGETVLIKTLKKPQNNETYFNFIKLLLDHPKIDINLTGYRDRNAMHYALRTKNQKLIDLFNCYIKEYLPYIHYENNNFDNLVSQEISNAANIAKDLAGIITGYERLKFSKFCRIQNKNF